MLTGQRRFEFLELERISGATLQAMIGSGEIFRVVLSIPSNVIKEGAGFPYAITRSKKASKGGRP